MILQDRRKSKAKHRDTPSWCVVWQGLFCIFTAMWYLRLGQGDRWKGQCGLKRMQNLTSCHWCWHPFLLWYTHSLCVIQSVFWPFVANMGVLQWAVWELTPVLPVVLFAVWCASPCGQTKPSSPRHDAWSDNNLQKPAQTQREREWVHLQQQDGQIILCAHRSVHVHTSRRADSVHFGKSWKQTCPFGHQSQVFSVHIQS